MTMGTNSVGCWKELFVVYSIEFKEILVNFSQHPLHDLNADCSYATLLVE